MQRGRGLYHGGANDINPDRSFSRLRGALFFGSGFKVVGSMLTFSDNLEELLASAVESESPLSPPKRPA